MKTLSALMLGLTMLAGTAAFAADSKDVKATTEAPKTHAKKHSKRGKKPAASTTVAKPAPAAAATAPAPAK